jgi:hypothetical protein
LDLIQPDSWPRGLGLVFTSMSEKTVPVPSGQAGDQAGGQAGGQADSSEAGMPRSYLVWSALVTALLFLPTGLVALFFSIRTESLVRRGEMERARRMSRAALAAIFVTVVAGVLAYVVVIGGLLALGAFSGG